MKKVILASLLCWSLSAAIVVTNRGSNTDSGLPVDVLFTNTTGHSIVAFVSYNAAVEGGGIAVTLNPSNAPMTCGTPVAGTAITTNICYVHTSPAGVTGVEIDSNNEVRLNLSVITVSGLNNAVPDATNSNTGVASSTVTTNSVTPATASNLVVAIGAWTVNDYSSGPTNGFTRLTQTGGGAVFQESAYLIQSSATAKSAGYTLTAGINWAAAIAVFGAPTSGPTNAQRSAGFFMGPP